MSNQPDKNLLKEFEESLNPSKPEESPIPIRILGYGEISTVFEITTDSQRGIAYKRMPLFENKDEIQKYVAIYEKYNLLLKDAKINLPKFGAIDVITDDERYVLFLFQELINPDLICNKLIHSLPTNAVLELVYAVLRNLDNVWAYNRANYPTIEIAIDGQISNFAMEGYFQNNGDIERNSKLTYIDTSTPMYRENMREVLNPDLFLKATPPVIRFFLDKLYVGELLSRYYDFRKVAMDLVANFFKERKAELVPGIIDVVNSFFQNEASVEVQPLFYKEVKKYYSSDARIWKVYLGTRKIHRFLIQTVLRSYYPFILPVIEQR